jgi:hypothetical protein
LGDGVAGVEPGVFEGGLELGFDFVGDVAVDLDDVTQAVFGYGATPRT